MRTTARTMTLVSRAPLLRHRSAETARRRQPRARAGARGHETDARHGPAGRAGRGLPLRPRRTAAKSSTRWSRRHPDAAVATHGADFAITTRFREIARARIIEPLPRDQAQILISHCVELAARFNRTAVRNKYEIEVVAVYGGYMSRQPDIADLELGITGRRRTPDHQRTLIGRATTPTEGTERIRELFERQSDFIEVQVLQAADRHAAAVLGRLQGRRLTFIRSRGKPCTCGRCRTDRDRCGRPSALRA